MSGKYLGILLAALLVIPVTGEAQVSPDTRLFQKPEWDGAVFTGFYLDGQARYQEWNKGWDKTKSWMAGPTFAMSFVDLPQLETGARFWWMGSDPKHFCSEAGFSDIDIWGKYQFIDDPVLLSAGMLLTLPTGDSKVLHPSATGEINVELFGAGRFYVTDVLALINHIGLRFNSDMDYKLEGDDLELDGKTQFLIGTGVILQSSPELDILGELNFATEAYKDSDPDDDIGDMDTNIELTGGVQYSFNENLSGRAGLGIGFADGAPKYELILGLSAFF
jgi:hypothetical protein